MAVQVKPFERGSKFFLQLVPNPSRPWLNSLSASALRREPWYFGQLSRQFRVARDRVAALREMLNKPRPLPV